MHKHSCVPTQDLSTEIDIWGLKFHNLDLSLIIVGSLSAVIVYFLIKFFSSYLFEKSSSTSASLATQIMDRKMSLNIYRAEYELGKAGKDLLRYQMSFEKENVEANNKCLHEELKRQETVHKASLKTHDDKIESLRKLLGETPSNLIRTQDSTLTTRENIETELHVLERARQTYLQNRESNRQQNIDKVEAEEARWLETSAQLFKDMEGQQVFYEEKRENINRWHQFQRTMGRISPFHLILEIWFPIILGLISLGSLGYLMFHFPPPPKPLLLPEF